MYNVLFVTFLQLLPFASSVDFMQALQSNTFAVTSVHVCVGFTVCVCALSCISKLVKTRIGYFWSAAISSKGTG